MNAEPPAARRARQLLEGAQANAPLVAETVAALRAMRATGTCAVCGRTRRLRKNGTLWTHGICRGAGHLPKEQL